MFLPVTTSQGANSHLLEAAKHYYDRGWSLFPVSSKTKRPTVKWTPFQTKRPSISYLTHLFEQRKASDALAVVSGEVSGMLALRDWDVESGYHEWAGRNRTLAAVLPTVKTKRGYHVYSVAPEEAYADLGDGEYRGNSKHYALLPPSPNYQWIVPLPDGPLPIIEPEVFGFCERSKVCSHILHKTTGSRQAEQQTLTPATAYDGTFASTLPTGKGQRNAKLFDLARHLKPLGGSLADAEPCVREWYATALPLIATKDWEMTWQDFCRAWDGVKLQIPMRWADITAAAKDKIITGYSGAKAAVVQLCLALQALHGPGKSWPLSCRLGGDYANVSFSYAARVIKGLVEGGVLVVTKAGSREEGLAAEYRLAAL